MGTGGAVNTRTAYRHLGPVITGRLRINTRLVRQHIGIAGGAPIFDAAQVNHVAGAGDFIERAPSGFHLAAFFAAHLYFTQLKGIAIDGGGAYERQG